MPTLSSMSTLMELAHEVQKHAAPYVTTTNVSLGVAGMLVSAGVLHGLPGPMLRVQADQMGMPGWFIMCAGWLMVGSGIGYWYLPNIGLYFVALCMGGAVATAAKMPSMMHRPGGMVFSNATLGAALWVLYKEQGEVSKQTAGLCAACYLAGVAGRVFVPTNPLAIRLLGWVAGRAPATEAAQAKSEPPKSQAATQGEKKKEAAPPAAGGSASGPAARAQAATGGTPPAAAKASARKRVSSPAPTADKK